jgi:hypothetical protein
MSQGMEYDEIGTRLISALLVKGEHISAGFVSVRQQTAALQVFIIVSGWLGLLVAPSNAEPLAGSLKRDLCAGEAMRMVPGTRIREPGSVPSMAT